MSLVPYGPVLLLEFVASVLLRELFRGKGAKAPGDVTGLFAYRLLGRIDGVSRGYGGLLGTREGKNIIVQVEKSRLKSEWRF